MVIKDTYPRTLHSPGEFIDNSLHTKPFPDTTSGFDYNRELLGAAAMNMYVETVGDRAGSLYLAVHNITLRAIAGSYIGAVSAITRHVDLSAKDVMLAFDYLMKISTKNGPICEYMDGAEEHGVTGKFKFLDCNVVNDELMIPIFSIPAQLGDGSANDIEYIDQQIWENDLLPTLKGGVSEATQHNYIASFVWPEMSCLRMYLCSVSSLRGPTLPQLKSTPQKCPCGYLSLWFGISLKII